MAMKEVMDAIDWMVEWGKWACAVRDADGQLRHKNVNVKPRRVDEAKCGKRWSQGVGRHSSIARRLNTLHLLG